MSEAVDALTAVAETVREEEQQKVQPEPSFTLSQVLRAMRDTKDGSVDGDETLVTLMCRLLDIPSYSDARIAVRAQVLG